MLAEPGETHCAAHKRPPWRDAETRRPRTRSGWARQQMSKRVIARDRGICHICGQAGADEADHVVELADGGADEIDNMRAAHAACNIEKMRRSRKGRR
jgi:5-methylcytosine-specific restriction enzyme A